MADLNQIAHPFQANYEAFYQKLDPTGSGMVPAGTIVEILKTSGLPVAVLGQIWEEADYTKRGSLDRRGVFIALKLVAAAQNGQPPTSQSLYAQLPPPRISGVSTPLSSAMSSGPASPSVPSNWGIGPADQQKYDSIFDSLGPEGGKLPGSKVRPVLLNSGLNPTYLAKIWELADQDKDGFLDRVEMHVALHLVYKALQGEAVPRCLPDHLIHPSKAALSRRNSITSASGALHSRAGSVTSLNELSQYGTPTHSSTIASRPYSVQAAPRPPSLTPQNTGGASMKPNGTEGKGGEWPVVVGEFAEHFVRLDTDRDGLVSGIDCRPFLMQSGLPQHLLAHVWGLVDIPQTGMLSLEQFSLLMYLIRRNSQGDELPRSLPPHLIPPSLRTPTQATPSEPTSPLEDDEEAAGLVEEIRKLEEERKRVDGEMGDIEEQMKAKQNQMKLLQAELKTLEGTVKQLEKQKAEANRRLGEMDDQRSRLIAAAQSNEEKSAETQKRIETLINETEKASASKDEDTSRMMSLQQEVATMEQSAMIAQANLRNELHALEGTVGELSRLEREATSLEKVKDKVQQVNSGIAKASAELDTSISNSVECSSLFDDFSRFALSDTPSTSHHNAFNSAAPPDPFGTVQSSVSSSSSVVKGGPPPRPAPPSLNKTPVNDPFVNADPFSGVESSAATTSSFADFANFGAFS